MNKQENVKDPQGGKSLNERDMVDQALRKKEFVKPLLKRHEKLPEITNQFVGTFSVPI
jgi:hypothetical protein